MHRKHNSESRFCYKTDIINKDCIKTIVLNDDFYLNYYYLTIMIFNSDSLPKFFQNYVIFY